MFAGLSLSTTKSLLQLSTWYFETGSLTKPGTNQFVWTGWPVCLHLPSNGLQMCCLCYVSAGDPSLGSHACWETLLLLPTLPSTPLQPFDHLSPLLLFFITEFSPVLFKCLHTNTVPLTRKGRGAEYCGKMIPAQCSLNHSISLQVTAFPETADMLTEIQPQPSHTHSSVNWATEVEHS